MVPTVIFEMALEHRDGHMGLENLTWTFNTSSTAKKAQQRLYFLRGLRKAHLPPTILTMFFREAIKIILLGLGIAPSQTARPCSK
ncbi:hypothetical protein P4O66_000067 [Electrophorus voltai]|uniref:Alkylated DNA repair protein AlkB homologue 8 N-terminal domain-containing protein n=1 Tax=Electrophorus voltai TaxID=2609070 RepID=A0AAD9E3T8_9TELE|nr:hypothetical protein P4O66_000067 [Electrophorus voltai]